MQFKYTSIQEQNLKFSLTLFAFVIIVEYIPMAAFMLSLIISYRNYAKANKEDFENDNSGSNYNCCPESPAKRMSEDIQVNPVRYSYLKNTMVDSNRNYEGNSPHLASIKRQGFKNNFVEEPQRQNSERVTSN
jgi:hypothetical protein